MTTPTARQMGGAVHQTRDGGQQVTTSNPNPLQSGTVAGVSGARGQQILVAVPASSQQHQPQLPSAHSIGAAAHQTKDGRPVITNNQPTDQPRRQLHKYS